MTVDTFIKITGTIIGVLLGLIGLWVFTHTFLSWGLW